MATLLGFLLRRTFLVIDVEGPSMSPTLVSGDRVLIWRTRRGPVRRTAIVVSHIKMSADSQQESGEKRTVNLQTCNLIIKRVVAVPGDPLPRHMHYYARVSVSATLAVPDSYFVLLGDNLMQSYDSRQFGFVHRKSIIGVVMFRFTSRAPIEPR
ncbi:S26 family signal peptidase [Streptosporangium amethystogenes]|uniref:S26 family signal peptidase n=1 Tax=Streptosporangium amethystogenes TaxID=2002 RepID=UPI003791F276